MLTTKNLVIVILSLTLVGVAPGCDVAPEDEDVEMAQSPVPYDPEMREFDPSSVEEVPLEDVLRDGAEDDAEPEFRFFVPSNLSSMTSVGGNGGSVFGTIGLGMIYGFGGRAGSRVDQLRIGFYLPAGHAGIHYQAGDAWWISQIADDYGGSAFSWTPCPVGYAARGFRGRSGAGIDKFGLICGPVNGIGADWYSPQYGGNGGLAFTRLCPAGKWLVGFDGRADAEVDKLIGLCANL